MNLPTLNKKSLNENLMNKFNRGTNEFKGFLFPKKQVCSERRYNFTIETDCEDYDAFLSPSLSELANRHLFESFKIFGRFDKLGGFIVKKITLTERLPDPLDHDLSFIWEPESLKGIIPDLHRVDVGTWELAS